MPKPLDPRLVRYARGVRNLLIGSVVVAAGTALLVIAQAFCLGDVVSRVFLGGATLSAVVEVEVITWIRCEGGGEPDISRETLELAFDLAGTGPRWQESGGSFRRIPSILNERNSSPSSSA